MQLYSKNKMEIKQTVNEVWEPLFIHRNGIRYIIIMGGRGAGRSYVASQFILAKLTSDEYFRCAMMRAVHSDIRLSLWQELQDRINEQEVTSAIRLVDNSMTATYGRNIVNAIGFRASSGSRSAKLKSLAGYNTVVIEEAEEIGEYEFMQLNDSLRTVQGEITIIFCLNTPPKNHWFIKEFFDLDPAEQAGFYVPRLKKEKEEDTIFLYYDYTSNVANLDNHTIKRYNEYQYTRPDYYYHMIKGYCPEVIRGRIYSGWRLIDELPHEARLVRFAIDWGWFPDPTVLVAIYWYQGGYIIEELLYGNHIKNETVAETILSHPQQALTVAGVDEPKSISELRNLGVNIVKVDTGPGIVEARIKAVSNSRISVLKPSVTKLWESYE
jgi:phage terminase large subunit